MPLETRYFEAYNRDNVHLVSLAETPIERFTPSGIQTSARHYALDLIVYATGFDAITGAYDHMDVRGVDGRALRENWQDGPSTYLGLVTHGFPNLLMVAGPQSVSGSTNFPRAIEAGVEWVTGLLVHARRLGHTRIEADADAQREWGRVVRRSYEKLLLRGSKGWFTGYNGNVAGHEGGQIRYQAYFGGGPRYRSIIDEEAADGYPHIDLR
jgi:cation diffusion facilitator CzcD-associated flavoprotein CzcO